MFLLKKKKFIFPSLFFQYVKLMILKMLSWFFLKIFFICVFYIISWYYKHYIIFILQKNPSWILWGLISSSKLNQKLLFYFIWSKLYHCTTKERYYLGTTKWFSSKLLSFPPHSFKSIVRLIFFEIFNNRCGMFWVERHLVT